MVNKRVATFLLAVLALVVSGCSVATGGGQISFREIFEARGDRTMRIERTVEMDVDGDNQDEWVVFYRYDPTRGLEWEHTPIQAIVYDALACDPPLLYNWILPFPDNDYVGEGENVRAFMADWLASSEPGDVEQELIIEGPGPANTLSIYRFEDPIRNPCAPPDPTQQGFETLGFFRANGPIIWDEDTKTVTTYQRTGFERSQLAVRSQYQPVQTAQGESFLVDGRTKKPDEQSIDFLYTIPRAPTDSPYPEKAVAAFYLLLGTDHDNSTARSFLTEELAAQFDARTWGLDYTPGNIKRALIYSISYTPDREAELARREREVTVVVSAVDAQNQILPPRRVTWRLVGIPIPGEQDCEWRLAEIKSVIVTPGLGMVLPGD